MRVLVLCGTGSFDSLHQAVADEVRGQNIIVVHQIGAGKFNTDRAQSEVIKFSEELSSLVDGADAVVSHCGAGLCYELISRGVPLIACVNNERHDLHQHDLARFLRENTNVTVLDQSQSFRQRMLFEVNPSKYTTAQTPLALNVVSAVIDRKIVRVTSVGLGMGNLLMKLSSVLSGNVASIVCLDLRDALISPNSRDQWQLTIKFLKEQLLAAGFPVFTKSPSQRFRWLRKIWRKLKTRSVPGLPPVYGTFDKLFESGTALEERLVIHFRRGDFVTQANAEKYRILDDSYYLSAITLVDPAIKTVSVVTDDEEHLPDSLKTFPIFRSETDVVAWDYLKRARYIICANSTFSLSAALWDSEKKHIIAPEVAKRFCSENLIAGDLLTFL